MRCAVSCAFWVIAEIGMQTSRFRNMPQPAECMVHGQRPQGRSMPTVPAIAAPKFSVKITPNRPAARPQVTPWRVSHGNQHTDANAGHIWNPKATARPPSSTSASREKVATSRALSTMINTPTRPNSFCVACEAVGLR